MSPSEYREASLEDVYDKYEGFIDRHKAERFEEWEMLKILAMYNLYHPAYKFKGTVDKNIKNPYAEKPIPEGNPRTAADVEYLTNYWNSLQFKPKVN